MRLVALLLLLYPLTALAQLDAPPEPPLPAPPPSPSPSPSPPPAGGNGAPAQKSTTAHGAPAQNPLSPPAPVPPPARHGGYAALVRGHKPSPEWTQDRLFTSTRFWLLDPGEFEVEAWLRVRVPGEVDGVRGPTEVLWQSEVEIGLVPHVQLDIYENVTFNQDENGQRGIQQEGNQIEARIAIPSYYGQIPTNPVLYFEWHPRHGDPDRFELRLLLGGAATRWLYLAANPYVETNVEETSLKTATIDKNGVAQVVSTKKFIADMEFGTTLAAGFRILDNFQLSAEIKIGADMLDDPNNRLHFVWFAGPGFIWKPLPPRYRKYLKILGTLLFAVPPTPAEAQQFEPLLIIGSGF